jgi:hypothetical protein
MGFITFTRTREYFFFKKKKKTGIAVKKISTCKLIREKGLNNYSESNSQSPLHLETGAAIDEL